MKEKLIILLVLLSCSTFTFSQNQKKVRNNLRKGNKEYNQGEYTKAEIAYRKSLEADAKSPDAAFNLGNSLYKQEKYKEADEQYQAAAEYEKDKVKKSWSYHNSGNVYLEQAVEKRENPDQTYNENLKKSIEAYKQALRSNPRDNETRYNLALAQKLLKDNEDNGGGGENDQKQDEQKKDEQKQDQKQDQQKQDQKQDQQQQPQMSQENAQQILDAMMQNEKNTQEKVKEQQAKAQQRKRNEKEW